MAEKELTPREIAKKNLESRLYQDVLATNNYQVGVENGKRGVDSWLKGAYNNVTEDKAFSENREELYKNKREMMRSVGVYGEPSMPTNADIALGIVDTIHRSLNEIALEDLYSVMTSIDSNVKKYSLPEKGKNLSRAEIIKKAEEVGAIKDKDGRKIIDIEKLTQEYQEAFVALEDLREIYEESCSERLRNERRQKYFEQMNNAREEKFHPKPKEADK